jgi:hypothetical protein
MTRLILLVLAALSIAAQRPPDESNVPPNEKRVPPGDYCKAKGVPIGPKETRAHTCECTFSCTIDEQGAVTEHEGPTCLTYCHVNGRRCTCHTEDPTPCTKEGHGNARMNMDGEVVAVNGEIR